MKVRTSMFFLVLVFIVALLTAGCSANEDNEATQDTASPPVAAPAPLVSPQTTLIQLQSTATPTGTDPVETDVTDEETPASAATEPAVNQDITQDFSLIIDKMKPSVVAIHSDQVIFDIFNQPQPQEMDGTGWVIDADGLIVTNNHVVENAENITVTLSDGQVFMAQDVMTDRTSDLAIIRIPAQGLTTAPIGTSSDLKVGNWVCAIGNPLGMGISATVGVISALDVYLQDINNDTITLYSGLIQTDAAINPGNSGGPLVNTAGEVVGINSRKMESINVEGMGYAIGIDQAMPIIDTLLQQGSIQRPYMGIWATTINPEVVYSYNLTIEIGVLVLDVTQDGPAEKAGMLAGDIITALNEQPVSTVAGLVRILNTHEIGETVQVTYWRDNAENQVQVQLVQAPETPVTPDPGAAPAPSPTPTMTPGPLPTPAPGPSPTPDATAPPT